MKNKQVKQMIVGIRDEKDSQFLPYFGHYFQRDGLYECFPNGSGPDNYYDDLMKIEHGVVSLTSYQLKGK